MIFSLSWLHRTLDIKVWLLLLSVGVVVLVYSALLAVGVLWSPALMAGLTTSWLEARRAAAMVVAFDGLLLGGLMVLVGARRALLSQKTTPEQAAEMRLAAQLARGPRVVAIGGGNGLAALLSGMKSRTSNLTAVVTMADDGGSSGLLRRDIGMPPPGDLRNCLVALADDESLMSRLFQHRFPDVGELHGHSFGNLFMAALTQVTGDFEMAVQESTHVLKVRGRVLPSTLDDIVLHAQLENGVRVTGESTITASDRLPRRVWLTPDTPLAVPQAVAAIREADLVVLGPGSLYTSVIPNLLIPEVRTALSETRGEVVYVCNVMTQPGETDGYSAADHLDALRRHGMRSVIDVMLVNDGPVSAEMLAAYQLQGAQPVVVDEQRVRALGVRVIRAPVARERDVVRHDPGQLAEALLPLVK